MSSLIRSSLVLLALIALIGCDKKNLVGETTTDSVSSSYKDLYAKYIALIDKNSKLIDSSYDLQKNAELEAGRMLDLDKALGEFTQSVEGFRTVYGKVKTLTAADRKIGDELLDRVHDSKMKVLGLVSSLEVTILKQFDVLDTNALRVYSEPLRSQLDIIGMKSRLAGKGNSLSGLRSLIDNHYEQLSSQYNLIIVASNLPAAPTVPVQKRIELRKEEAQIAQIKGGQGFLVDNTGAVQVLKDEQSVVDYAAKIGIEAPAARSGYYMSSQTGGLISFAPDNAEIPKRIQEMLTHMKGRMAANPEGLECMLVLDYSGSMSDKIRAVIEGLKGIVESLDNVTTKRSVKIGIITFGAPGREAIDLPLTNDLIKVRTTLDALLENYPSNQHSIEPGEASYHGLYLAAHKVGWSTSNRMSIVITDELAWELEKGNQFEKGGWDEFGPTYVNGIFAELKARGVQNSIYSIITRRRH